MSSDLRMKCNLLSVACKVFMMRPLTSALIHACFPSPLGLIEILALPRVMILHISSPFYPPFFQLGVFYVDHINICNRVYQRECRVITFLKFIFPLF